MIRSAFFIFLLLMSAFQFTHPAKAGDQQLEQKLRAAFEAGRLKGLHNVLVRLDGKVLAEVSFPGEDQRWGRPIGVQKHGPNSLHDMRSVTKSVVALLYGIALSEGIVPAVNQSLIAQFPEYRDLAADAKRRKITIGDTLSMQMGTRWNENLPYTDPANSEIAMERAKDRYRFVLAQPMVVKPGTRWNYSGGATAIIAGLIARGAKMPIDAYARKKLFGPLGITSFEWVAGADGVPSAASGLRLSIRDLAKIGQLVADNGAYKGKQIIPAGWLKAVLKPRAAAIDGLRYGYFWWLAPQGNPPIWVAAFGNGGQRLTVQPKYNLVITILAGNYNRPDDWKLPVKIIEDYLSPAIRAKIARK